MDVEAIKQSIRDRFGDGRELQFGGGRHSRQLDDGRVRVYFELGQTINESVIQADFHQERFETEEDHRVHASPDGSILDHTRLE